ncbi:MAG: Rrf2 family transcriptional regulator [Desulfomicrobium escambiense]|nr:Rrf2 family transcriptional regulator [Desulfomicrobium escambiense]
MYITLLQENGLKISLALAKASVEDTMNAVTIAKSEKLKPGYVGKILFLMRKEGLIKAKRGRKEVMSSRGLSIRSRYMTFSGLSR